MSWLVKVETVGFIEAESGWWLSGFGHWCVWDRGQIKFRKTEGTNARDRLYVLVTMVSNDTLYYWQ